MADRLHRADGAVVGLDRLLLMPGRGQDATGLPIPAIQRLGSIAQLRGKHRPARQVEGVGELSGLLIPPDPGSRAHTIPPLDLRCGRRWPLPPGETAQTERETTAGPTRSERWGERTVRVLRSLGGGAVRGTSAGRRHVLSVVANTTGAGKRRRIQLSQQGPFRRDLGAKVLVAQRKVEQPKGLVVGVGEFVQLLIGQLQAVLGLCDWSRHRWTPSPH